MEPKWVSTNGGSVSVRKFFSKGGEIMKGVFPSLGIFKQPIFVLLHLLFFSFFLSLVCLT